MFIVCSIVVTCKSQSSNYSSILMPLAIRGYIHISLERPWDKGEEDVYNAKMDCLLLETKLKSCCGVVRNMHLEEPLPSRNDMLSSYHV